MITQNADEQIAKVYHRLPVYTLVADIDEWRERSEKESGVLLRKNLILFCQYWPLLEQHFAFSCSNVWNVAQKQHYVT